MSRSSRTSPRMIRSFGSTQQSRSEVCPYINESTTITSCPSLSKLGTKTEPMYPAPPVTNIFISNLFSDAVTSSR